MTADHSAQFEEVMALLDGELPADAAERVRLHLAACAECQRLATEMRDVSGRLAAWQVGPAPATLQPRRTWAARVPKWLPAAAAAVLIVGAGALLVPRQGRAPGVDASIRSDSLERRSAESEPIAGNPAAPAAVVGQDATTPPISPGAASGPLIIQTASLSIVVRDYEAARDELDRIAKSVSGFIGDLVASGARGAAPSLRATLRVPATRLDETIAALKRLGEVQHETQGSDDVTQQSADLDARLSNARASEARLKDVLQNRTGRLADVLAVEREIARVRGEIEQMEAERKNLDNRITYANVTVELTSERKAEGISGPMSVSTRLRNAVVDGYAAAVERAIALVVFVAEVLPTLLLWAAVVVPPAMLIRRRWVVRSRRV